MFQLGKLVQTAGVANEAKNDPVFAHNVLFSLNRYKNCDWGDLCEDDKGYNNDAVIDGDRIVAAYNLPTSQSEAKKIYIITEWDRSVTTILFPEEY
jgi:hypothetical protein